jgi:hypothetical protein
MLGTPLPEWFAALAWVIVERMVRFMHIQEFIKQKRPPSWLVAKCTKILLTLMCTVLASIKISPLFKQHLEDAVSRPVGDAIEGLLEGLRIKANLTIETWMAERDETARAALMEVPLKAANAFLKSIWNKVLDAARALGVNVPDDLGDDDTTTDGKKSNKPANGGRMEGMGDKSIKTLDERLRELEPTEGTRVGDVRLSILDFSGAFASHWRVINEATQRRLLDPDEIIRAAEASDDGELADPDGGTAFVTNRVFALKRLAASCKKLVGKARDEDGTGPKKDDKKKRPPGAIGDEKIPMGPLGEFDNPTWHLTEEPDPKAISPSRQLRNRNIENWKDKMGPAPLALAPGAAPPRIGTRITSVLNLRGRAASLWARRRSLGTLIASPFVLGWRKYKTWRAARNAPANPPSPPTTIPPPPPTP